MKKRIIILLAALLPLCIVSCAETEKDGVEFNFLPGKWEPYMIVGRAIIPPYSLPVDTTYYYPKGDKRNPVITFVSDGTGKVSNPDGTREFTWTASQSDTTLLIQFSEGSALNYYKVLFLTNREMCLNSLGFSGLYYGIGGGKSNAYGIYYRKVR